MATTSSTPTQPFTPARTVDAFSAWAQASERVLAQLVELSVGAARESLRTYGELQAATIDSARSSALPPTPGERGADGPWDWYSRSLLGAVESSERFAKLMETHAQIVARGTERYQATAERAGKDIREAVETYIGRMREIYSSN
jgi:hypothetical protein